MNALHRATATLEHVTGLLQPTQYNARTLFLKSLRSGRPWLNGMRPSCLFKFFAIPIAPGMCGRYPLPKQRNSPYQQPLPEDYQPGYNIGPDSEILTAAQARSHTRGRGPAELYVAPPQTADSSPRFREAWEEHRCSPGRQLRMLNDGVRKQPHYIPPTMSCSSCRTLVHPHRELAAHCVILTTRAITSAVSPHAVYRSLHHDWLSQTLSKDEVCPS